MFIQRLAHTFESAKIDYAIVGGYAVMLHGAVRGTIDVDIIININKTDFIKTEEAMLLLGLTSRLPVKAEEIFNFRLEYIKNRNLIAWNFYNPRKPSEQVDIIITQDRKKVKTITIKSGTAKLKVIAMDDLIKMKLQSGRAQDIEDVKSLKELRK